MSNWKGKKQPFTPKCKEELALLSFAMAVIFFIHSNVKQSEETPATALPAFASSAFPLRKEKNWNITLGNSYSHIQLAPISEGHFYNSMNEQHFFNYKPL